MEHDLVWSLCRFLESSFCSAYRWHHGSLFSCEMRSQQRKTVDWVADTAYKRQFRHLCSLKQLSNDSPLLAWIFFLSNLVTKTRQLCSDSGFALHMVWKLFMILVMVAAPQRQLWCGSLPRKAQVMSGMNTTRIYFVLQIWELPSYIRPQSILSSCSLPVACF